MRNIIKYVMNNIVEFAQPWLLLIPEYLFLSRDTPAAQINGMFIMNVRFFANVIGGQEDQRQTLILNMLRNALEC